jgi:DNA-binding PadR family transcriptional regulator
MKEYRERSGVRISTGNFYRELQHLVTDGLVRTAVNPPGADARRAPYEITDAGIEAFDEWLAQPNGPGMGQHDDDLSARALFIVDADPALARRLLEQWREELWIRSKILERDREASLMRSRSEAPDSFAALPFLLSRRLRHLAADLEFLQEFSSAYENWSAAPVTASVPASERGHGQSPPSVRPLRRPVRGAQLSSRRSRG